MYRPACLIAALLFFPALSLAADAGFPPQSVWLSDAKPVLGEKIRVYAVVYNGTDAEVAGALTFLVDGKQHESKTLSLDPGESSIVSSPWTAVEGEHAFSARFLQDGTSESAAQVSASITASVEAPPSAVEQTITEARTIGSQIASTSLPIVTTIANKVFETTESIRNAGISYLEEKTEPKAVSNVASAASASNSNVEGFQKETATESNQSKSGLLGNIGQTASAAALFTLRSLWLFYPILVGFLLMIFRWLYRWATGPRI